MKKQIVSIGVFTSLLIAQTLTAAPAPRQLSREALLDKIRGAWAGQMIGVSYGAPTEFRSNGKILEGEIKPEPITNAIDQDDLYVEMTFARVMDTVGLNATSADYGEAFKNSQYRLWHANASGRKNLNRGIRTPMSGHPKYNLHADDIDFQIEADFIGIMCPGLPREVVRLCDRVGHVMNYGDGVYGGTFVCGMYAAAYFENDPRRIVEAGLACIPPKSTYAATIRDLLAFSAQNPTDWRKVWQMIQDKWDKDDPCPEGAMSSFNIDAKLNGAYIAFGLLYGGGDFDKTMEISTRCGQDSDCNPSSAVGVLGAMIGWSKIPEKYRAEIAKVMDTKFSFTDYSFTDIVKSTETRALEAIRKAGGKITDMMVTVPVQTPKPPKLEQCDFGVPDKVLPSTDAAWQWSGAWTTAGRSRVARGPGAEASIQFTGTGIALVGNHAQDGGRADVYLDGKKRELLADAYIPERTTDQDLWHVTGLKPGLHTLRLVTRDDADIRSKGKRLAIDSAVIYRAR